MGTIFKSEAQSTLAIQLVMLAVFFVTALSVLL